MNYWDKVTLYVKSILDNLLKEKKTCQKYINCCQELKIGSIQNGKWCSVKAKQYQRTKPATFYCCFICARHTPQWTMRKLFCRYLIAIWALTVCFVCAFVLFFLLHHSFCLCIKIEHVRKSHISGVLSQCVSTNVGFSKILCDQFAVVSALMPRFDAERAQFICLTLAHNAHWTRHWRDWRHTCSSAL